MINVIEIVEFSVDLFLDFFGCGRFFMELIIDFFEMFEGYEIECFFRVLCLFIVDLCKC